MEKVKVLIVDDSAVVRQILSNGLSKDPGIEVVGTASDVYAARDKIVYKKPDVITLDVEMPRMDGIEFLRYLMPQFPIPVIMVSSLTEQGSKLALDALEAGAVEIVPKPSTKIGAGLEAMMAELIGKVKMAAKVDVSHWKSRVHKKKIKQPRQRILEGSTDKVIAMGASTGGTIALANIIENVPANFPGTVIVQHMPPVFTKSFAERLNDASQVEVKEAVPGDRIITGRVLIAPGGYQMKVRRSGGQYIVNCLQAPPVNGHCPSVDVLFDTVAEHAGSNALGVLLTGMGRDGALGLLHMKQQGAGTFCQDEKTCVVFGMPGEAVKIGAADKVVPIDRMTAEILQYLKR